MLITFTFLIVYLLSLIIICPNLFINPANISVSIPLIAANAIFLVKETSVVGIIAVKELMNLSKTLIGVYYKTYETMFLLVVFYLIILLPLSLILSKIERKMRYAEHGN